MEPPDGRLVFLPPSSRSRESFALHPSGPSSPVARLSSSPSLVNFAERPVLSRALPIPLNSQLRLQPDTFVHHPIRRSTTAVTAQQPSLEERRALASSDAMESFPLPPIRRGSTPVAGAPASSYDSTLAPPLPHLTLGEDSSTMRSRSVSPTPSRPRRSSKRVKGQGDLSPVSSPMVSNWSNSTATSTDTLSANEQLGLDRARDVNLSLGKLGGTYIATAIEQERVPSPPPSLRNPFAGAAGAAKAGSPRRLQGKVSNGSIKSRMTTERKLQTPQ